MRFGFVRHRALKDELAETARAVRADLADRMLPYWAATVDREQGGYRLADPAPAPGDGESKQIVSQARMLWSLSHAHARGFGGGALLAAARHGYDFLRAAFFDREHGGVFWSVERDGRPRDERKIVYGHAFALYALTEYGRASGDADALASAGALFDLLQARAHDGVHGGWIEHFARDWVPLPLGTPRVHVERAGMKSANTHLHLLEAFAAAFAATARPAIGAAAQEALRLCAEKFHPPQAAAGRPHFMPDWSPPADAAAARISYGHNIEFAWLMVDAQRKLGLAPSWPHFDALVDHALRFGFDYARGGVYLSGPTVGLADDLDFVWWVQGEAIAALTEGLAHAFAPERGRALLKMLRHVRERQADPADGIWRHTLTGAGSVKNPAKLQAWKSNYHDIRALVKFCDAFAPRAGRVTTR